MCKSAAMQELNAACAIDEVPSSLLRPSRLTRATLDLFASSTSSIGLERSHCAVSPCRRTHLTVHEMAEMNKVEFLECENKLLLSQQNNYKELCKVLTERHVEILKYLTHLKTYIEKILSISKENVMFTAYLNDKSIHECNIVKYDKQIQILTESIQSSQAQISDNEGNLFKEQLKLLSTTLDPSLRPNNSSNNYSKYNCGYFECREEFTSKNLLEAHMRNQHNMNVNFNSTLEPNNYANNVTNYEKKDLSESKMNDVLFVPQMELEVLDYNNSYASDNNHSNHEHGLNNIDKNNGFKKLAPCDFCGKYFNKHYLESHKRSHTGAKPFKCSIDGCNRTFTQSSSRNFHEKRFHRVSKYVFKCSYSNCEMSFDRLEEMQKHLQQHQALINTVTHSIEINGLKLAHPQIQSANSIKVKGNRSKPNRVEGNHKHVCVHCGKSFAYKIALKQHGLMHGNKNFRCPYENCNYASYWKHNLGLHLRKHHNSEPH